MSHHPSATFIASRDNQRFKALLKLVAQPRLLRKAGQAIAEGVHLLQELSQWPGVRIREIWFSSGLRQHREWPLCEALFIQADVDCVEVSDPLYAQLSELEQGAGPLILFDTPLDVANQEADHTADHATERTHVDAASIPSSPLPLPFPFTRDILLLDGVQDPGNVGTLIRTAAAVGITEIWTTADCAWVWSGKVLRAAMGGHRHVHLPGLPANAFERVSQWRNAGVPVRLTQLDKSTSLFEADLSQPGIWLLGSEGKGVSDQWAALANQPLRIPMQAGVESLNVASAAAVCLYEQWRQRSLSTDLRTGTTVAPVTPR